MDPVSVAAAAASITATSLKISYTLYTFVNDVREVDENVKAFHDEILGLSRISDAIQKTWTANATIIASRAKEDGDLWFAVQQSLQDCDEMVQRLDATIRRVSKDGGPSRNLANKISKAVKLNMKEREVEQYRRQINTHCNAMQTGLSTIQISLQLSNNAEQARMNHCLEELRQHMVSMKKAIEPGGVYDTFSNLPDIDKRTANRLRVLVQEAESFHTSTSTLVGDTRSTVWDGSILGDPLSHERITNIRDWIPPPIVEDSREGPLNQQPALVTNGLNDSTGSQRSVVAAKFYELAMKNLNVEQFAKAEGFFRKFFQYHQNLNGDNSRMSSDETEIYRYEWAKILLYYAYCVQRKWEAAAKFYQDFIASSPTLSEKHTAFIQDIKSLADHQSGRKQEAIRTQEYLYDWKCTRYGLTSEFTYFTIELLISFYEENGDTEEVEVFSTFLPEDYAERTKSYGAGGYSRMQMYLGFLVEHLDAEDKSLKKKNLLPRAEPVPAEQSATFQRQQPKDRKQHTMNSQNQSPEHEGSVIAIPSSDDRVDQILDSYWKQHRLPSKLAQNVVLDFWNYLNVDVAYHNHLDKDMFTLCGSFQHPDKVTNSSIMLALSKTFSFAPDRTHEKVLGNKQQNWQSWWRRHLYHVTGCRIDLSGSHILVTIRKRSLFLWHIPERTQLAHIEYDLRFIESADFNARAGLIVVLHSMMSGPKEPVDVKTSIWSLDGQYLRDWLNVGPKRQVALAQTSSSNPKISFLNCARTYYSTWDLENRRLLKTTSAPI